MSKFNFYEDRILELSIETGGSYYDVIYAHHQNGGFCCIPNWKISCEAGEPSDTFYNTERLEGVGIKGKDAKVIALAIKAAYEAHKDNTKKSCRNCEHYRMICEEGITIPSSQWAKSAQDCADFRAKNGR